MSIDAQQFVTTNPTCTVAYRPMSYGKLSSDGAWLHCTHVDAIKYFTKRRVANEQVSDIGA
jgi:hypothetical protein